MKWRQAVGHPAFWPVMALLLWWMVVLALPKLETPEPTSEVCVRGALQRIAADCTTAEEARAKVEEWPRLWNDGRNSYTVEVEDALDGGWCLMAEPARKSAYCRPLWKRFLFLDFRRREYGVLVCHKS